jgi:hypothetical protein
MGTPGPLEIWARPPRHSKTTFEAKCTIHVFVAAVGQGKDFLFEDARCPAKNPNDLTQPWHPIDREIL